MYLLARPPYVRWAIAALLVAAGVLVECGGSDTTLHPFTATDLARGDRVPTGALEWRHVPAGLFVQPDLEGAVAVVDLPAGTPLLGPLVSTSRPVPDGWWAVTIDVPETAREGSDVLVVLTATGEQIPGIVLVAGGEGGFGIEQPGVVAVPAAAAAGVATATLTRDVVVAVRPQP